MLTELDQVVDARTYSSRSEAARDALREFISEFRYHTGLSSTLIGAIVFLHEHGNASSEITKLQHEFAEAIVAVHHVHLSDPHCFESIAVNGSGERIRALLSRVQALNGVHQTELAVVGTG